MSEKDCARSVVERLFHESFMDLMGFYCEGIANSEAARRLSEMEPFSVTDSCERVGMDAVTSSIRIASPQIDCSLEVTAEVAVVKSLCPQHCENSPTDWIDELANQLAGRLKNKLGEYNVDAEIGLPVSACVLHIRSVEPSQGEFRLVTETPAGEFVSMLQLKESNIQELQRLTENDTAAEGSLCLF